MIDIPILFTEKFECCGCSACYAVCPQQAIYMLPDEEGFEYPHINDDICVRCYLCVKICPNKSGERRS